MVNNWPSSIIIYYSVEYLYYLGDICSSYKKLLPKLRFVRTGYFISMLYLFKAKVELFVYCILCIKCRWRPLQTDRQNRSPFIYGYPIISVGYMPIANSGITLIGALYRTAKLTIQTSPVRRTTIVLDRTWKPVQPEMMANTSRRCPLQTALSTTPSSFKIYTTIYYYLYTYDCISYIAFNQWSLISNEPVPRCRS